MSISIRTAQHRDVAHLPEIDRAAEVLFPDGLLPEHGNGLDVTTLAAAVEAEQLLVAEIGGQVVLVKISVENIVAFLGYNPEQ